VLREEDLRWIGHETVSLQGVHKTHVSSRITAMWLLSFIYW